MWNYLVKYIIIFRIFVVSSNEILLLELSVIPDFWRVSVDLVSIKSAEQEDIDMLHSLGWWRFVNPLSKIVVFRGFMSINSMFFFSSSLITTRICISMLPILVMVPLDMMSQNWSSSNCFLYVVNRYIIVCNVFSKLLWIGAAGHYLIDYIKSNANLVEVSVIFINHKRS